MGHSCPKIRAATGSRPYAGNIGIAQQYRISEYIKTILNMGLAFGIAFQTPVVVVMLGWVGIINPGLIALYGTAGVVSSLINAAGVVASTVLPGVAPMSV